MWCGVSTERFFPALLFMGKTFKGMSPVSFRDSSFPDRTANLILSHAKPLQWLGVERRVYFTEGEPCHCSLLRAQTLFLPFRVPHSCLFLWLYVRCCLSCWIMKLSLGLAQGKERLLLWFISSSSGNGWPCCRQNFDVTDFQAVWIAAASQSQPVMCGCEHMAQCIAYACSPCSQACLCLPG